MKVMNKLQSAARSLEGDGISLGIPRIAVVGPQSAGKSSLLEQIAQDQFLPRGVNTVTKCPVMLQFINSDTKRYVVDGKECTEGKMAKEFILAKSKILAERDGGISNEEIGVEIYSPDAPDMTLIDLPGLIAVQSDNQSKDLPERIESLVLEYIRNEKTIILAVATADSDFQTGGSLRIAREVDPNGNRTLAVLTKIDKVFEHNDKEEIKNMESTLRGANIAVKLGIVGVINRTKNISFQAAKQRERELLNKHFRNIAHLHGIDYLGDYLGKLQMHHIQDSLHDLIREIERNIQVQQRNLGDLGRGEVVDKRETLKKVATRFARDYAAEVEGSYRNINTETLSGGANIKRQLDTELNNLLTKLNSLSQVTDARIIYAISNSPSIDGINCLTEVAFDMVVKSQILEMEPHCVSALKVVHSIMRDEMPKNCYPFKNGSRPNPYPPLQAELVAEVEKLLQAPYREVEAKIEDYIQTQAYTSRTYNKEFLSEFEKDKDKMLGLMTPAEVLCAQEMIQTKTGQGDPQVVPPAGDELQAVVRTKIDFIKNLVTKKVEILKGQVLDHVPKIIKKHLIFETSENIHMAMAEFFTGAIANHREGNLIRESDEIIAQRKTTQEKIWILQGALNGFREVKDMVHFQSQSGQQLP